MKTYGVKETLELLDAIVADVSPEHTAACIYRTEEGEPICIVGQVVYRVAGVDGLSKLIEEYPIRATEVDVYNKNELLNRNLMIDLGFDDTSVEVLAYVQELQDASETWTYAVEQGRVLAEDLTRMNGG